MTNKSIGTEFEQEMCKRLAQKGWWVHFIVPDARGAQPFDIVAVKNGVAVAIDCKTCVANTININRLEDNQIMSFEKWLRCGNEMPMIAVKHNDMLYWIRYDDLKKSRSINLKNLKGEFIGEG